jgi:hypothetical protein
MNKKLAIIVIVAVFLIGAIFGYEAASRKYEYKIQISSEYVDSGFAKNSVDLLNLLRTNDTTKAIDNLEMNLDWDLINLSYSMSNASKSPLDPYFLKAIRVAKEYREKFPHKGENPSVDQDVSNTFLRVNTLTNK